MKLHLLVERSIPLVNVASCMSVGLSVCLTVPTQIRIFTTAMSSTNKHESVGPVAWPNIKKETQQEIFVVDGHGQVDT